MVGPATWSDFFGETDELGHHVDVAKDGAVAWRVYGKGDAGLGGLTGRCVT